MLQDHNGFATFATMTADFDDAAFLQALEARRKAEQLSWRQLGRQLDLSPSTFSRLARGRRPDVETFLRLLRWLNMPVETFMRSPDGVPSQVTHDTLSVVATALHTDPSIPTGAAGALENLFRVAYANITLPRERKPARAGRSKRNRDKSR